MDERGTFIATLLDVSRKAYAAGAVSRMAAAGDATAGLVESWGFQRFVADTQVRLENLAEALAVGREELFQLDIEWLQATYAAREIPLELIERSLRCLREELEQSLPSDAVSMPVAFVNAGLATLGEPRAQPASRLQDAGPHVELARRFLLAVLEGRRRDAVELLVRALDGGASVTDLHLHVIARAQAEMGRMWQAGEVNVAEEHLGSRAVEEALTVLRNRMPRKPEGPRTVLTASVAGNLHDIGARMVADHFEMHGWKSLFLGANVPVDDLVRAVADFLPDLLALSVGMGLQMRATAEAIGAIRGRLRRRVPVLVGGPPFSAIPGLWRDVGADGCATDALEAVREGEKLAATA